MVREILFRGKNDSGKWVYGWLGHIHCYNTSKKTISSVYFTEISDDFKSRMNTIVDYKTVGQFTGLTDKNGKKIFEGDILKFSDCGIYPVWWDADFFTFGSCWFSDFDPLYKYDRNKIEVIGNIHDNPELLGGGEGGK